MLNAQPNAVIFIKLTSATRHTEMYYNLNNKTLRKLERVTLRRRNGSQSVVQYDVTRLWFNDKDGVYYDDVIEPPEYIIDEIQKQVRP